MVYFIAEVTVKEWCLPKPKGFAKKRVANSHLSNDDLHAANASSLVIWGFWSFLCSLEMVSTNLQRSFFYMIDLRGGTRNRTRNLACFATKRDSISWGARLTTLLRDATSGRWFPFSVDSAPSQNKQFWSTTGFCGNAYLNRDDYLGHITPLLLVTLGAPRYLSRTLSWSGVPLVHVTEVSWCWSGFP